MLQRIDVTFSQLSMPTPAPVPVPQGPTFIEVVHKWDAAKRTELRVHAQKEAVRLLTKDAAKLHALPIDRITRRDIAAVLADYTDKPGKQRCTHANVRRVIRWAIGAGLIDTDPTILLKSAPPRRKERVLSEAELRVIWEASQRMGDYGRILRLLMLTGQRRGEIGGLTWGEINRDQRQIELPGSRTKNKKAHIVPLSALALAQLPEPRDGRPWLFGNQTGRRFNSWGRCKEVLDASLGGMEPWDVHDIRRSFVTHMAERGLAEPHIVEAIVNHQSGHKAGVAGTYNRARYLPQRRAALDAWAVEVRRIVGSPS